MKNFTKKIILATTVLAIAIVAITINVTTTHAVGTTWYACSGGGNWSASVWTSILADEVGCTGATGHPVAGDTAILNSSSGNITVNTASNADTIDETGYTGTLAFGSNTLTLSSGGNIGGAMTATTGSLVTTGGTLTLISTATGSFPTLTFNQSPTITFGVYKWPGKMTVNSSGTITLSNGGATSEVDGLFSVVSNTVVINQGVSGDTLTLAGGLLMNKACSGTANFILTGGTWSGSNNLSNNLTLAGNVTVSGQVNYLTGTLTYSSGAITTTGSTLILIGTSILNTDGMTWNIAEIVTGATYTLASNLEANTLYISGVSVTFAGAYDITISTLKSINNVTLKIVSGQTLNISSAFSVGGGVSTTNIQSVTASSPAYIVYTGTVANEDIVNTNFTDIQATAPSLGSLGANLASWNGGTLTRTSGILNVDASNLGGGGSSGFMIGAGN